jgi:Skp family chaperone for outer membrane proteins
MCEALAALSGLRLQVESSLSLLNKERVIAHSTADFARLEQQFLSKIDQHFKSISSDLTRLKLGLREAEEDLPSD